MGEPPKWYSDTNDYSPFIKALAEARRIGALRAGATTTSARFSWRSTNTPKPSPETANSSGTSRTRSGAQEGRGHSLKRQAGHAERARSATQRIECEQFERLSRSLL